MANIYVTACCQLDGYDYDSYLQMYELSKKTVLENVSNIDKHVLITGRFSTAFDMFKHIFWKTAVLSEKNNIFFVDVDMLCIKKLSVFGLHDTFCMFGGWDNTNQRIASYIEFEKYFSASPRYIPQKAHNIFSHEGGEIWGLHNNIGLWDHEQVIYNILVRKQKDFDVDKYFNMREYNYIVDERAINQCNIEDAIFLHFSGSRCPANTVVKMKEYLK